MQFDRTISLIGEKKFQRLTTQTVVVLGLGGVGSYAVEALVRSGIGHLIIIDADTIAETNLNRQLMTDTTNIGEYKVDVWENRIRKINANCHVTKIREFITEENLHLVFECNPDYIVDCIDTLKTKKVLIKRSVEENIKIISSMGMGNKLDATRITITDISKTSYDKIAKEIRNYLKKERINKKIPVVFSDEQPIKTTGPIASISFVPAVAGLLCANYVINDILKVSNEN